MSNSLRFFRKLLNLRGIVYPLVLTMIVLVGTGTFIQSTMGNRFLGSVAEESIRYAVPTIDVQIGKLDTLGWNGIE